MSSLVSRTKRTTLEIFLRIQHSNIENTIAGVKLRLYASLYNRPWFEIPVDKRTTCKTTGQLKPESLSGNALGSTVRRTHPQIHPHRNLTPET